MFQNQQNLSYPITSLLQVSDILRIFAGMNFKKIIFSIALLLVSVTLAAQQKPSEKELQLVQSLQEAQINGSDSDFYEAHKAFMDYLEQQKDWNKYYRTWLNRIIYEVNHKRFHRAYAETDLMTDDIKARHQEGYIYMLYMGLGFFYNGRNQPEMGEKFFRRALEEIQADKDPVAVFNAYLSLAQSLSFKRPAEAMACLVSQTSSMPPTSSR